MDRTTAHHSGFLPGHTFPSSLPPFPPQAAICSGVRSPLVLAQGASAPPAVIHLTQPCVWNGYCCYNWLFIFNVKLNIDCLTIFHIVLTLTMTWLLIICILISSLLSAFTSWQIPFSEYKLHDCFLSQSIPCVWNGRLLVNISWMYMWMNEQTPRKESLLDQTLVRLLSLRLGPPMHFLIKSSFSKNPALSTVLCSF